MKVIFLDIDGVLNHSQSRTHKQVYGIDPDCVGILDSLLDTSGAVVVISSSWRLWKTPLQIAQLIQTRFPERFIDSTPVHKGASLRGHEIDAWLREHMLTLEISHFLILDDDSDMLLNQMNNFIQTSDDLGGLQKEHLNDCLAILNKGS